MDASRTPGYVWPAKMCGKILAYNKNKPGLITILHEECFFGFKAHARDILSMVFDWLS